MNWQAISSNPFFTVALPIMITLIVAMITQNKRVDDLRDSMNKRFDGVDRRLDGVDRRLERIEIKLDSHAERIARLEGPPLVHARE